MWLGRIRFRLLHYAQVRYIDIACGDNLLLRCAFSSCLLANISVHLGRMGGPHRHQGCIFLPWCGYFWLASVRGCLESRWYGTRLSNGSHQLSAGCVGMARRFLDYRHPGYLDRLSRYIPHSFLHDHQHALESWTTMLLQKR